jgi:hypothetical protein
MVGGEMCSSSIGSCFCGEETNRNAQCWLNKAVSPGTTLAFMPHAIMHEIHSLFLVGQWQQIEIKKQDWHSLKTVYLNDIQCQDIYANGILCIEMSEPPTKTSKLPMSLPTLKDDSDVKQEAIREAINQVPTTTTLRSPTARARAILINMLLTTQEDDTSLPDESRITDYTRQLVNATNIPIIRHDNDLMYLMLWETQMRFILIGFALGLGFFSLCFLIWALYSYCRRRYRFRRSNDHYMNELAQRSTQIAVADSTSSMDVYDSRDYTQARHRSSSREKAL